MAGEIRDYHSLEHEAHRPGQENSQGLPAHTSYQGHQGSRVGESGGKERGKGEGGSGALGKSEFTLKYQVCNELLMNREKTDTRDCS